MVGEDKGWGRESVREKGGWKEERGEGIRVKRDVQGRMDRGGKEGRRGVSET